MNRPLSLGFTGAGFISRFHLQSLVAVRDCVVGGITSHAREWSQEAADLARELRLGEPKVHDSLEELAADPGVDAVWVCGRNDTRLEQIRAIAAGAARRTEPLRGIACEKPLARTLGEAEEVAALAAEIGAPTGYLEDMLFAPHLVRGREILWRRGAALSGRPYLARAAEEHSGPHSSWFWQGRIAGGGVLLDMMCHSLEAARWLLTEPGAPRGSLTATRVSATTAALKWGLPEYAQELRRRYGGEVDWERFPSEDFARATVHWRTGDGQELVTETTSSWSYVGAGLRHTFELLGPEYSLHADLSNTGLSVFFSRKVQGAAGEDLVEKQNAEQGQMPVAPDETGLYGYVGENRHFVNAFRDGTPPGLTFADGVEVMRLLMACYRSAETGAAVDPADDALRTFVPAPARAPA